MQRCRIPSSLSPQPGTCKLVILATVLSLGLPEFVSAGDPQLSANTCAAPAASPSLSDPFTTTFPVTVNSGDAVLSAVIGYRAVGKTVASVSFNGSQSLTKSAG